MFANNIENQIDRILPRSKKSAPIASIETIYVQNFVSQTLFAGYPMEFAAILYATIGPYSGWDQKPFERAPRFYADLPELAQHYIDLALYEEGRIVSAMRSSVQINEDTEHPHLDVSVKDQNIIYDSKILLKSYRAYTASPCHALPFRSFGEAYIPDFKHRLFIDDVSNGVALFKEVTEAFMIDVSFLMILRRWLSVCPVLYRDYCRTVNPAAQHFSGAPVYLPLNQRAPEALQRLP